MSCVRLIFPCRYNFLQSGHLQLFDVSASVLLEEVPAHQGAVWGLSLSSDKRGVISGSADKSVRFWEFELTSPAEGADEGKKSVTTLVPYLALVISDDVNFEKFLEWHSL